MQTDKSYLIAVFIVVTIMMMVITTLLVTLIFRYIKKQADHSQAMDALRISHAHNMAQIKTEVREMTLMHISREIHDDIISSLSTVLMGLNNLQLIPEFRSNQTIGSSTGILKKSITGLRDLSHSLHSHVLNSEGLIIALEEEIQRVRNVSLFTIDMDITGEYFCLEPERDLIIFRIIQEAFHNTRKHASATKVFLSIKFTPVTIEVSIRDNGKGFRMEENKEKKKNGMGLKNMRERIISIGGDIDIKSSPGDGTSIDLRVPASLHQD